MNLYTLQGEIVLVLLFAIILLITCLVLFLRYYLSRTLTMKLAPQKWSLKNRTKRVELNVFRYRDVLLNFGLCVSLSTMLFAFNWAKDENAIAIPDHSLELEDDIELIPPRTADLKKIPPPPPNIIDEVPEEEMDVDDQPEFLDVLIDDTPTELILETEHKDLPPPPPPPGEQAPDIDEIVGFAEEMPRFPGCENETDQNARKTCAQKKMLEFIYSNIKYPAIARENAVQGTCVVRFVVEKDGSIADPEVVRDIGAGCGVESLRVVKMMNSMPQKWTPGKQRGRAVRVQFNLPVKFKLE